MMRPCVLVPAESGGSDIRLTKKSEQLAALRTMSEIPAGQSGTRTVLRPRYL